MEIKKDKITEAVRNYNRAKNRFAQAHSELIAAIPDGITVLHCLPGEIDRGLYWSYGVDKERKSLLTGVHRESLVSAIIIEAPSPADEC